MFTRIGRLLTIKNKKQKSFSNENDNYKAVLVKTESGEVRCLMFTDIELIRAEVRGEKNSEDQPKQSWISKIID
jgi:hypothetical protein